MLIRNSNEFYQFQISECLPTGYIHNILSKKKKKKQSHKSHGKHCPLIQQMSCSLEKRMSKSSF